MSPIKNRKRNRLAGYDYSKDNLYFVTTCVQDRVCCFGEVHDTKMHLNAYGKIANGQLEWLAKQYAYVTLHEYVVMPNHVHAIIEIERTGRGLRDFVGDFVGTGRDLSLQNPENRDHPIKIKSLSELMGAFKTTASKQIHQTGYPDFTWQRSFHDIIIRDHKAYVNISDYIRDNPAAWERDKFSINNNNLTNLGYRWRIS